MKEWIGKQTIKGMKKVKNVSICIKVEQWPVYW